MKKLFINLSLDQNIREHIKRNYRNSGVIQESYYTRYVYFLHKLYVHETYNKDESDAPVNTNDIAATLSLPNKEFNKIKKYFIENKIIEKTSNHIASVKSSTYKIKYTEITNKWTLEPIDNLVTQKIIREEIKNNKMTNTEFFRTYEKYLHEIKIDINLYKLSPEVGDEVTMNVIEADYKFFFQPHANNRVYHQISSMKRSLRKYLKWDEKRLYQIDITGSQMFLIAMMFRSYFKQIHLPDDVNQYIQYCKDGQIYEVIAKEAGIELTKENRSQFKKQMMSNVVFIDSKFMNNKLAKAFEKLFPNLYNFIKDEKAAITASKFALNLQAQEWDIIQSIMIKAYAKGIKCVNLHDCIIFNDKKQKETLMNLFEEEFIIKYNVVPAVKFSKF